MKTNSRPLAITNVWLFAVALNTSRVFAQFMLSPVAVSESGLGTFSTNFTPLNAMIDQSGIKVPFVSGSSDFDTYFAPPNNNFSQNADKTKWQSDFSFDLPFGGLVDFDLGDTYRVSKAAIWNVSVKDMTVQVATSTNGPWQDAGQFSLGDQQGSLSLRATVLGFDAEHVGRFIRLAVTSEYTVTPRDTFGYVTIGEFVVRASPLEQRKLSIQITSDGDVLLAFPGHLQSSTNASGPFEDVLSGPQGTYTIPKASLNAQQFFRSRN